MKAVIGSHVLYKLDAGDVGEIERQRTANPASPGYMHGNFVSVGQVFPAFIVADFSSGQYLNLQVLLDGTDSHWATSRQQGDGPGQWQHPAGPAVVREPGIVYIPLREGLGVTAEKMADLQQALETVAGGWVDGRIVVLPPGAKVLSDEEAARYRL